MAAVRRILWAPVAGELHAQNVSASHGSADPAGWLIATSQAARSFMLACALSASRLGAIAQVAGASASPLDMLGRPRFTEQDRDPAATPASSARSAAARYWAAMEGALRDLVLHGLAEGATGAPRLDDALLGAPAGLDPLQVVGTIETPCTGEVWRVGVLGGDRALVALRWRHAIALAAVHAAAVDAIPGFLAGLPSVPALILERASAERSAGGAIAAGAIAAASSFVMGRL